MEAPHNVWLLASTLTGETVRVGERYPHICSMSFPAERTITKVVRLIYRERDCAACGRVQGRTVR